jgi:hypothetical protein
MSALITTTRFYRLYILIASVRYYANRPENFPEDMHMRWSLLKDEYPDHFNAAEANKIREFYLDQDVKYEKVYLNDED